MSIPYDWAVIMPKATINWVANADFSNSGSSAAPWVLATGAALSTDQAWHGIRSLKYYGTVNGNVLTQPLTVKNGQDSVTVSAYVWLRNGGNTVAIGLLNQAGNAVLGSANADNTKLDQWQRVSCTVTGVGITANSVQVFASVSGTVTAGNACYFDAFQVENGNTLSGYFDGLSSDCAFIGAPWQSPSLRPLSARQTGIEVSIGNVLTLQGMKQVGTAPVANVNIPNGLVGGETYQRTVKQARDFTLPASYPGQSLDDIESKFAGLEYLLSSNLSIPQKPATLVFNPSPPSKQLEIDAEYTDGINLDSLSGLTAALSVNFHAPDPYFRERQQTTVPLTSTASGSSACFYQQPYDKGGQGAFAAAGTIDGNASCGAWIQNPVTGNTELWLGGQFTHVGGAAAKQFAVLNTTGAPSTLAAINTWGVNPGGNPTNYYPYAICQLGPGSRYVWIGGSFGGFYDYAGVSHAYTALVRLDLVAQTVSCPIAISSGSSVQDLAYDQVRNILYVGGTFTSPYYGVCQITNPDGASPAASATSWGTPVNGSANWLALRPDGALFITSNFQTMSAGYVGATSWSTIGTVAAGGTIYRMAWGPDGQLYAVGEFTSITPGTASYGMAYFNGGSWVPIPGRSQADTTSLALTFAYNVAFDSTGRVYLPGYINSGANDTIAGSPDGRQSALVVYDGSGLHAEKVSATPTCVGQPWTSNVFVNPWDDAMFFCQGTNQSGTYRLAQNTVVNYTGTAPAPVRIFAQATTADTLCGIRNERTGQAIYFRNLLMAAGETIIVDTDPTNPCVYSTFRSDLRSFLAPGCDLATLCLLPGANYVNILTKGTGTVSWISYYNRHLSIDGAGSSLTVNSLAAF